MKREIKFRGKRKDSDQWIIGSYHLHHDVMLCIATKEQMDENMHALIVIDGMSDWGLSIPINTCEVIPESLGQFTGLKDSNGKEIYEDDIVKGCCFNGTYAYGTVIQSETGWIVSPIGRLIEGYDDIDTLGIEVIGNIHDDNELLK